MNDFGLVCVRVFDSSLQVMAMESDTAKQRFSSSIVSNVDGIVYFDIAWDGCIEGVDRKWEIDRLKNGRFLTVVFQLCIIMVIYRHKMVNECVYTVIRTVNIV